METIQHILPVKNIAGEGPIWNTDEQALYWVDVPQNQIYRFFPITGKTEIFDIGMTISALAFRKSGGMLLATKNGISYWDTQYKNLEIIIDRNKLGTDAPLNDGSVDKQGRFWVGTWGGNDRIAPTNNLYRLSPGGSIKIMETGIYLSNGIGWSPDDRYMYLTDSSIHMIYIYDYDPGSGSIDNKRIFVQIPDDEGEPDGLTVDSDGFVWSARWDGWKISRYDPKGKIEREILLPVQRPTNVAFGGTDMCDLFITTACLGLTEEEKREQPLAGDLFKLRTDDPGLEEPKFLG